MMTDNQVGKGGAQRYDTVHPGLRNVLGAHPLVVFLRPKL